MLARLEIDVEWFSKCSHEEIIIVMCASFLSRLMEPIPQVPQCVVWKLSLLELMPRVISILRKWERLLKHTRTTCLPLWYEPLWFGDYQYSQLNCSDNVYRVFSANCWFFSYHTGYVSFNSWCLWRRNWWDLQDYSRQWRSSIHGWCQHECTGSLVISAFFRLVLSLLSLSIMFAVHIIPSFWCHLQSVW